MFDVENELPYLGSDKGKMDILVHFMEKIGEEPCMIHNQDRNKFGIFIAHDLCQETRRRLGCKGETPFAPKVSLEKKR